DHRKLALDRAAGERHVDHAVDRHHAVELVLDLLDHHRGSRGDDGDAREMLLALGLRHREALDVVAAAGEQADHAREHAGLVRHEHRERVRLARVVAIFEEVGRCGLVHDVSPGKEKSPSPRSSVQTGEMVDGCSETSWTLSSLPSRGRMSTAAMVWVRKTTSKTPSHVVGRKAIALPRKALGTLMARPRRLT